MLRSIQLIFGWKGMCTGNEFQGTAFKGQDIRRKGLVQDLARVFNMVGMVKEGKAS